ncbi:MAG TPA: molybdopterin cofactor-binding domain-containing protein, partial [Vicinamibacterales bacterium]|nr:molybdopterin cofactor-binding domain-containing protein [Vicinamibacterales bacterium]
MTITRRGFIRTTSLAAGLTLSFRLPGALADEHDGFRPNAFLHIGEDEAITVFAVRLEMGQGVRTLLPMMIAEELDVDWGSIRVEQATPGGPFKEIQLHTSGSSSSSETFMDLRRAGAAAREMLIQAAAGNWGVEPGSCRTERGAVIHPATGRRRTYGQLAAAAARQSVPKEPALKPRTAFRMLGTPMKRIDGPAIVTGRAPYGLDVRVPGMLYASIERAPTLGATMRRFDAEAALKLPGVRYVVPVTRGILQGVAVVADDTWSAMRARRALHIEWEPGPAADFDSDRYLASLPAALERASFAVRHEGDADAALAGATRRVDATYVFPFQAHAPIESMNCTADVRQASAEFWVPTQTDVRTLDQAAKVTGLPRDAITVHCALMGGGFGRRLFADYVAEAAEISQRLGRPVQVCWTREDDMRRGYFQPATAQRFTGGLDAAGRLVALVHRTSASDLTIYDIHGGRNIWTDPPKPPRAADAYAQDQSPWGAYDNPYAIAHLRVDCADVTSPVPTGPWRAVEYPSTVFGRESFLDELAHAAGADPIAFRLA